MKKSLLSAAIALTALSAFADFQGDGYYRVQNAMTKRYAYLLDNKGSFDTSMGTADVKAIKLFMNTERMISDPACVFYIDCVSGEGTRVMNCNIAGQGTSLYAFFGEYMKVMEGKTIDGIQTYYAYATKANFTKYLGDRRKDLSEDEGNPDVEAAGDYRLWYIDPVKADSETNYFGIDPSLDARGRFYQPFFAGFPFSTYSSGMKVYTVGQIDTSNQVAVIKELKGTVAQSTPVIIECAGSEPTYNRLNIGGSASKVTDNRLSGVYFCNETPYAHRNLTPYNKRTMRILTAKNGELFFDVADIVNLPKNEAYLQLSNEAEYAVSSYRVMTEDEYETQYGAVGVIGVDATVDVYGIDGRLVKSGVLRSEVSNLGKGIYILRSGYDMEKLIIP